MNRILRWIGAFLGIGSDSCARATQEDALHDMRHRTARYY